MNKNLVPGTNKGAQVTYSDLDAAPLQSGRQHW